MTKIVRAFEDAVPRYPATDPVLRKELAKRDLCPECGGQLDTGWECNACGYDARDLACPLSERMNADENGS